jgi:hypothetical protein
MKSPRVMSAILGIVLALFAVGAGPCRGGVALADVADAPVPAKTLVACPPIVQPWRGRALCRRPDGILVARDDQRGVVTRREEA